MLGVLSEGDRWERVRRLRALAQEHANATGESVIIVEAPTPTLHGPQDHTPYFVEAKYALVWEQANHSGLINPWRWAPPNGG